MTATARQGARRVDDDLLDRLQELFYEYEALGELERARPHILWLMEIARTGPPSRA